MNKNPLRTLLLPILAALLAGGCSDHESDHGQAEAGTIRAQIVQAERIDLAEHVMLQGTVESDRAAAISARVMAMVTAIHAHAGDHVDKGQLLLEIDPQTSKGQVAQARGAQAQAQAALALAERNFERFKALAETNAASELEVDMARMQLGQAKGAVEQASGAVQAASSVAADSRVVAPFAGRIVRRMVDVGDLATPGRPLLMMQSELARRLAVTVPESLAATADLQPGRVIEVELDTRPDLGRLQGIIEETAPGADPLSHSFLVKIGLPGADISTGTAGRAHLPARAKKSVVIPDSALYRRGGLELIVIRNDQGLASSRVVTTGRELGDDRIEILSGLNGGESLLVGLDTVPPAGTHVEESR